MSKTTRIDSHLLDSNGRLSLTATGFYFEVRGSRIKAIYHSRWQGSRDCTVFNATDADLAERLCDGLDGDDWIDLHTELSNLPAKRGDRGKAGGAEWRCAYTGHIVR
jgi:hypothetical protein